MSHIITVPAFSDNYIWLICDQNKKMAAIVDPGDANVVLDALEKNGIQPAALLITHFHHDHVGGIAGLLDKYPDLPVYGPATENIPHMTHPLNGDELLKLENLETQFQVMNVPGHTAGHIAYFVDNKDSVPQLFCGDTLFAAGCGRVFNGTLEELHHSLQAIKQLPTDTLIYCAHEYTLDNLGFAKWVEPDSGAISTREEAAMDLLDNDQPTVPSTLALELETNPFLRTDLPHIKQRVSEVTGKQLTDLGDVFAAMRTWKDTEYD